MLPNLPTKDSYSETNVKAEQHQLLVEFNDNAIPYPGQKSIVALFEEQVLISPDTTALIFEDQILTYDEIQWQSNQVAHYLFRKGVEGKSYPHLH